MNKLIKIILSMLLAVALIAVGYNFIYLPYYCNIEFHISKPANYNDSYFCMPIITYNHMSGSKRPQSEEISKTCEAFTRKFLEEHQGGEYKIDTEINIEKGQTHIIYKGFITNNETGIEEPFEKEFVFDFILTREVY